MGFGENIAAIRKKKGLSQEDLAKKVGTISVTIGRYECDEIIPSIDLATKIAEVLEVSLDYLVGNSYAVLEKALVKKSLTFRRYQKIKEKLLLLCSMLFSETIKLKRLMLIKSNC
jgi:transcriptional regulator with XRE-family HTH domain